MKTIKVEQDTSVYNLKDERFICDHNSKTIEKACCSTVGESGYIECGCGCRDTVTCENVDCTGLEDDLPEFNNECWG